MFGQDDNQQQPQDTNGPLQAAMPDPVPDSTLGDTPAPSPVFGAATPTGAPIVPTTPNFGSPDLAASSPSDPAPASDASSPAASPETDDLINLKQQALQQLSPLVSHLDQTPEEKFRTTMMMIQASDDQSLIKSAFEAAQAITDDKARAQALLDVINEINYFTQHSNQ